MAENSVRNISVEIEALLSIHKLQHFCFTAPALIESIQERNKKVSLGLLEKAKSICASRGVWIQ